MKYDLLGMAEAASVLGVSKQRLSKLIESYADFPAPVANLRAGRIWASEDVEAWAKAHGRTITPG